MQFDSAIHSTRSDGGARAERCGLRLALLLGVAATTLMLAASPAVARDPGDGGGEQRGAGHGAGASDAAKPCRGGPCLPPAPAAAEPSPAPVLPATPDPILLVAPALAPSAIATTPVAAVPPAEPVPPAGGEGGADLRAVDPGANAERSFTILIVLGAVALVFLALQGRLDRRDPKLGGSPDVRDDSMRFR